jgi:hypothetical protein
MSKFAGYIRTTSHVIPPHNIREVKAGDKLSSRHVSSCDVTRAFGMWDAI